MTSHRRPPPPRARLPEREPEPLYLPLVEPGPELDEPDEEGLEEQEGSVIVIEVA